MKKIQEWIEKHLVPVMNRITQNFWFGIVADAILYIVPFSMVSAIPSLWSILRRFVPVLPDISPLSTFSFGLIGLFVSFVIPYNCLNKIGKKDRSMIAGFTGIGTFMMCMNFVTTDEGSLVAMSKFGAGGMFTAMFVGLLVAVVYKAMFKFSFFGEDSVIPDFVKNWFDNIIAILISLTAGYLLTYVIKIDVFTMVQLIMKPITSFAQSGPGVVLIVLLQNVFYFFGISGWVFTPVTRSITQAAIAENAAMMAAGMAPKNIYAYAQHILSNPTDAADITQEVMIKLWNTRRELKGVQNPRAWALKVTRNLCLDWIKKQKPVYGGEELAQNEDYTSNPLQEIETKDTVSLLRQIIDTLPENQREVLILREIEELEFEEIEQITGLTANHIRVLLSRGRSKVKEMMRNER